jgi:hypothetical protein
MLASGTQVRRFKPGRSHRIFSGVKILNMPSFADLRHGKEPLRLRVSRIGGKIQSAISRPSFPPSLTEGSALARVVRGSALRGPLCSGGSMGAPGVDGGKLT